MITDNNNKTSEHKISNVNDIFLNVLFLINLKIIFCKIDNKNIPKTKYKFIVNKPISSTNVYPRSANTTRNNSLNKTEVDAFILFFIINE